jgi:hypothetical protein
VIVVDDRPDLLVLWSPRGTCRKVPVTPPTRSEAANRGERLARSLALGDWILGDSIWDVSTLWLLREGDWHAVWVSFLETGEQWGWYVNFQEPFTRNARGIQTMDLALDIIVEPDRSSWRWKDEDEFELFQDRGLIDETVARRVRDEADSVIERIAHGAPPFNGAWPGWRPDGSWPIPELPAGWDAVGNPAAVGCPDQPGSDRLV